jgi:large subunit ribosomal protein L31
MRKEIHPDYHPVVYVDVGADFEFVSRSTMTSEETRSIDGVDHYVIKLEISSASHPFYTGKQHFVDTAGRIEKFRRRFGERGSKKTSDDQAEQTENG